MISLYKVYLINKIKKEMLTIKMTEIVMNYLKKMNFHFDRNMFVNGCNMFKSGRLKCKNVNHQALLKNQPPTVLLLSYPILLIVRERRVLKGYVCIPSGYKNTLSLPTPLEGWRKSLRTFIFYRPFLINYGLILHSL